MFLYVCGYNIKEIIVIHYFVSFSIVVHVYIRYYMCVQTIPSHSVLLSHCPLLSLGMFLTLVVRGCFFRCAPCGRRCFLKKIPEVCYFFKI